MPVSACIVLVLVLVAVAGWVVIISVVVIAVAGSIRTMLGSSESAATLGAAPCAIAWLFRGIAELRARGGARFSVRVSAVEAAAGGRQPLRDLLAAHAHGKNNCAREKITNNWRPTKYSTRPQ